MEKEQLRRLFKQRRLELSDEQVKQLDGQVLAGLQELDYTRISFLHVYLAIRRFKEFDLKDFIVWIRETHPLVRIVVSQTDFDTGMLRHFVMDEHTIIVENRWGIPEPANEHELIEISPEQLDAVLVPLLAYDRYGNRLGYGKGFYDRFLRECRDDILKIGISYFDPLDEPIPADEWDMPLDKVVCPNGIVYVCS